MFRRAECFEEPSVSKSGAFRRAERFEDVGLGYKAHMDSKRPPRTSQLVEIYLRDHYAGATAGLALFRRAASSHSDASTRTELGELATETAGDRDALRAMMRRLQASPSRTKMLLSWVGEKVGRLKGNGRVFNRSPLSDVLDLEALIVGVRGKASGWEALRQAAELDHRLEKSALQILADRAEDQLSRLQQLHRASARSTFGTACT